MLGCGEERERRFTPTCVGTTVRASRFARPVPGSPPRVWGQPEGRSDKLAAGRFTPTCVGTTSASLPIGSGETVHPHVCGDNCRSHRNVRSLSGSPPRVWGQLGGGTGRFKLPRFTPTCVGTTQANNVYRRSSTVHPHVCGDNHASIAVAVGERGSPPRVWGQRRSCARLGCSLRFTPTCVGTTIPSQFAPSRSAVHPHVCGDNSIIEDQPAAQRGSPPRVWGQPRRRDGGRRLVRFTPTCVGTTAARL